MIKGQCTCTAVTFQTSQKLTDIYMCHCTICRRFSGTNGMAVCIAHKDQFSYLSGQDHIATWQKPNSQWQGWFCRTCGSPLPGTNDDDHIFIPAGLITEGGDDLKVTHHLWTDSKANWDEIGDQGKCHHQQFTG